MKQIFIAVGLGTGILAIIGAAAFIYPSSPAEQVKDFINAALDSSGVVTVSGNSETETLERVFAATARADKETYPVLNSMDYEKIYGPDIFRSRAEMEATLAKLIEGEAETAKGVDAYFELRKTYVTEIVEQASTSKAFKDGLLEGFEKNTMIIKPYNATFIRVANSHVKDLIALYRFMLAHYGEYVVADNGDGPEVVFDDPALTDQYYILANDVVDSAAEVGEKYNAMITRMNETMKENKIDLDANEMMDKVLDKYY